MTKELTGRVYDIQGFSVQDGPGIRTTVFLKGCPLRCPWCHSPESQEFYKQLSWVSQRCLGVEACGRCLNVCPNNAITLGNSVIQGAEQKQITLVRIDRSLCNNCGACSEKCYPQALFICGTDYTVNDIVARVLKDRLFYENSGGGVTVSGGEPLAQPEFTLEVFKRLKEAGINTALDTTGYVAWNNIDAIIPYTDLFLYDIKHMASADHKALTGVPNQIILENAKKIAVAGGKLQIRIPLIPHFNDSDQNLTATANFCKDLGDAIDSVQLLPYHNMGTMKYLRLAEDTKVMEATPHTDVQIANIRAIMEGYGFHVTVH